MAEEFVWGLTAQGFRAMTLLEARDYMNKRVWAVFSPTFDLSDGSYEGQEIGILAELLHKLWMLGEILAGALDKDKASNSQLDGLANLIGTFREGARASTSLLTLTGVPTTLVPAGSGARVPNGPRFDTTADATIDAVDPWLSGHGYAVLERAHFDGNVYQVTRAGASSLDGPTGTDPLVEIVDGTVKWRFLGEGEGAIDAAARATVTGPQIANAYTITEVATPFGGWTGVINLLDAVPGRFQMEDAELRLQMDLDIARAGTSPKNAIRSDLLEVGKGTDNPVSSVTIFSNRTDATNADGLPPHSIEALVEGGEDQAVIDQLALSVADGVGFHGDVVGTAIDAEGNSEEVRFSRPELIPIYIEATVYVEEGVFPPDGAELVEQAIVGWGDAQRSGKDVVANAIGAQTFKVTGVLDHEIAIGTVPGPSSDATIVITQRQKATYDTSRVNVTVVPQQP